MQNKTLTPVTSRNKWKKTAYLLVISALLLVLGLSAMFTLGTASVRFDRAYDNGDDLSAFYFEPLAEGENYSALQKIWLARRSAAPSATRATNGAQLWLTLWKSWVLTTALSWSAKTAT